MILRDFDIDQQYKGVILTDINIDQKNPISPMLASDFFAARFENVSKIDI
jgi:hypothetical protein